MSMLGGMFADEDDNYSGIMSQHFQHNYREECLAGLNEMEVRNLTKGKSTSTKKQLKNKMNEIHKVINDHYFGKFISTKFKLFNLIDEVDDLINKI